MKEKIMDKINKFMEKPAKEKMIFLLPYILAIIIFSRIVELYRLCNGNMVKMIRNFEYIYKTFPQFAITDILIGGLIGVLAISYIRWNNKLHRKNTREGEEYGGARWGTPDDIKPFIDDNPFYNVILSDTERLSMSPRMKKFSLNRNKNLLVYGSSGSGKTFGIVKPNMMQLHSSIVVTDPKGTLLPETGKLFERAKYRIKVLDTVDFENSMHYNPFAYINEPKDILTFANALLLNLKGEDVGNAADPFWDKAALLWLQSIIGLLWYEAPAEEQNMATLIEFLDADEAKEDNENYKNAVDLLFEELEKENPRHFAVKQRKKYKKAAGKTAKSILITLGAMLSPFDIPEVVELMQYDELDFDTYGDEGQKTILYVIISDTDETYNFIPSIMFTQIFNVLCYKADKVYGGRLKTSVQFILDEFAQFKIPKFKILISTIRSRMISCILMLQTQSQLKDNYKDAAETIIGNCDTQIFLGGQEKSTLKDLDETLGQETIDLYNESKTFSVNDSTGLNYNKTGKKLKDMYDLSVMNRNKCIVRVSGLPPFFSDKYDPTKHPYYKYLADADIKNIFDFKKYREKLKQKESVQIRFHKNDQYMVVQRNN